MDRNLRCPKPRGKISKRKNGGKSSDTFMKKSTFNKFWSKRVFVIWVIWSDGIRILKRKKLLQSGRESRTAQGIQLRSILATLVPPLASLLVVKESRSFRFIFFEGINCTHTVWKCMQATLVQILLITSTLSNKLGIRSTWIF